MIDDWQRQRGRLNHDWLKNIVLPRLASLIRVLKGEVESERNLSSIAAELHLEWVHRLPEFRQLLEDSHTHLSPQQIMNAWGECLPKSSRYFWLADLTHALWIERERIELLKTETQEHLLEVQAAIDNLSRLAAAAGAGEHNGKLSVAVQHLHSASSHLSAIIERFPSYLSVA